MLCPVLRVGGPLLLPPSEVKGSGSIFLFSPLERDETVPPLPCLKTVPILPLCREELPASQDSSRLAFGLLWPLLVTTSWGSPELYGRMASPVFQHLFCCVSPLPTLSPRSLISLLMVNRDQVSPSPGLQRWPPVGSHLRAILVLPVGYQKRKCPALPLSVVTFPE